MELDGHFRDPVALSFLRPGGKVVTGDPHRASVLFGPEMRVFLVKPLVSLLVSRSFVQPGFSLMPVVWPAGASSTSLSISRCLVSGKKPSKVGQLRATVEIQEISQETSTCGRWDVGQK